MAIAYFDASALVKLIVDEPGSEIAEAIWDGCDAAVSSRLAFAEVCAALAAAGRRGDLDESEVVDCEQRWQQIWASVQPVELSERRRTVRRPACATPQAARRRCSSSSECAGARYRRPSSRGVGSPPPRRRSSRTSSRRALPRLH